MRRWFAIVLLCLLPLQFGWAAVAPYCVHEAGNGSGHDTGEYRGHRCVVQSKHLGQHLGEHQEAHADGETQPAAQSQADSGDPNTSPNTDVTLQDCGQCHGACVGLAFACDAVVVVIERSPACAPLAPVLRMRPTTPPDRPQWAPLA